MKRDFAPLVILGLTTLNAQADPIPGQGTWETTLKARDIYGQAVQLNDPAAAFFYDSAAKITWLADMNAMLNTPYEKISGTGRATWNSATAWVNSLTAGGFTDWRLPRIIDSNAVGCDFGFGSADCGWNVQTRVGDAYSEYAHLYYETLGNVAVCNVPGDNCFPAGPKNTAYFKNMQERPDPYFWSSTLYADPDPGNPSAWLFDPLASGYQGTGLLYYDEFAAAVRDGDVLSQVPEPPQAVLTMIAVAVVGLAIRRNRPATMR